MRVHRVAEVAQTFDVHPNTSHRRVKTCILYSVELPGSHCNRFTVEETNRPRRDMDLPTLEQME